MFVVHVGAWLDSLLFQWFAFVVITGSRKSGLFDAQGEIRNLPTGTTIVVNLGIR